MAEERCWICKRTENEVRQALIKANQDTDWNMEEIFFVPSTGLPPFCWVCTMHILSIIEMTKSWEKEDMKKAGLLALFSLNIEKLKGEE